MTTNCDHQFISSWKQDMNRNIRTLTNSMRSLWRLSPDNQPLRTILRVTTYHWGQYWGWHLTTYRWGQYWLWHRPVNQPLRTILIIALSWQPTTEDNNEGDNQPLRTILRMTTNHWGQYWLWHRPDNQPLRTILIITLSWQPTTEDNTDYDTVLTTNHWGQ